MDGEWHWWWVLLGLIIGACFVVSISIQWINDHREKKRDRGTNNQ